MRANLQVNVDRGRARDCTSGNFHRTSVREKSSLFANRLSFSDLFDDISLMLKVRRLCVVVDSLISAANVCGCVISVWCCLNIVSSVFSA